MKENVIIIEDGDVKEYYYTKGLWKISLLKDDIYFGKEGINDVESPSDTLDRIYNNMVIAFGNLFWMDVTNPMYIFNSKRTYEYNEDVFNYDVSSFSLAIDILSQSLSRNNYVLVETELLNQSFLLIYEIERMFKTKFEFSVDKYK